MQPDGKRLPIPCAGVYQTDNHSIQISQQRKDALHIDACHTNCTENPGLHSDALTGHPTHWFEPKPGHRCPPPFCQKSKVHHLPAPVQYGCMRKGQTLPKGCSTHPSISPNKQQQAFIAHIHKPFTSASGASRRSCSRLLCKPAYQPPCTKPHQTGCPLSCGSAALLDQQRGRRSAQSRRCNRPPGTCPPVRSTCSRVTHPPSRVTRPPCECADKDSSSTPAPTPDVRSQQQQGEHDVCQHAR